MAQVTCKTNSSDIRIYINDILHLRLPRDPNTKIQSWWIRDEQLHVIEVHCVNHSDLMEYESRDLWIQVLKALDENI